MSTSRLRELLTRTTTTPHVGHNDQDLFDELHIQTPRLQNLFDVGARNPQKQRELDNGRTSIHGRMVNVGNDFARQVNFLSQELESSETHVSELLFDILTETPNIEPVSCIEQVVSRFHLQRRQLVDCLRFLLETTEAVDSNTTAATTPARLAHIVRSELLPAHADAPQSTTLTERILNEIDNLDRTLLRADNARRNAGSNTVAPGGQAQPALGLDVLNSRYDSLKYERRYLATCLCLTARLAAVSTRDAKNIVEWLSRNPNHPLTFYFLVTLLTILDPVNPQTASGQSRAALAGDNDLMTFMTQKLGATTSWNEPGLKGTVLLKWTLFLTEARHRDPRLEHKTGFHTEELEAQVWNAVQADTFNYLALATLQLQRKPTTLVTSFLQSPLSLTQEQAELREPPADDFKPYVLSAFETLIRSLITHASSELRKIKQKQEDFVLAGVRSDRQRGSNVRFNSTIASDAAKQTQAPRNDIAMLYTFIGLVYSALPPERALQFWGSGPQVESSQVSYLEFVETTAGKLPAFLQWAVWSTPIQDPNLSAPLYDMLTGLATGQQCSELAYNFMARAAGEVIPGSTLPTSSTGGPTISWTVIFSMLESWASFASNPRPTPSHNLQTSGASFHHPHYTHVTQQIAIGPKEVLLAQACLRLLSTVVSYSVPVRLAISNHGQFRAIPTLLALVPLSIPLELKGTLFETVAAFCQPGAGLPGIEICKMIWSLLERSEVINVRVSPTAGHTTVLPIKGVEIELEQIEAVHRMYPSTIPFLRLLSTLIHSPKRIPLKGRVADIEPVNTIPDGLGQPYRLPGVGPFTAFVVDNVFVNIPNREYSVPSDRWLINDLCLCYVERALASFDLESLAGVAQHTLRKDLLPSLVSQPGYDVLQRMLTNSPLQANILSYVVEGVEGFEKGVSVDEPSFGSTITRVLRIVQRVLEIQDLFLDLLLPLLSEYKNTPLIGTIHSRSYYTKLDQALSFSPRYVPALAAYLAYPRHAELVLLSIKIITALSNSSHLPNIVTLIDRSQDSDRILNGFVQILHSESMDDVDDTEALAEQITGAGAEDPVDDSASLQQAIRTSALHLLIQETEPTRPYPTISHFLLFGSASTTQIQDPLALGARETSIHVLLSLVNRGVPRLHGKGKRRDHQNVHQDIPLYETLPGLAERCYRVLENLCVHPRTSEFTMRYLRSREDFFARQLSSIPSKVPEFRRLPPIEVVYNDGSRVLSTVGFLSAFLRLRSYIFDLVALELHTLTNKGHFKAVSELLDILIGNGTHFQDGSSDLDRTLQPFRDVGQSYLRVIEFFQSLMFDWSDSLTVEPMDLQYLGQLDLQSCFRVNNTGCEIVDRSALLALLSTARKTLHGQGAIVTSVQSERLATETNYILESCAVENHRREVAHAVSISFETWRRLLDVTLMKCFDRLPREQRENMLFDLLNVIPAAIKSQEVNEPTAVLLSETILSCITKLREDRRHQLVSFAEDGRSDTNPLPAERLYTILRNILEGIINYNRLELVRGNLYAALINYINLVSTSTSATDLTPTQGGSLTMSTNRDDVFNQSLAIITAPRYQNPSSVSVETGSMAIVKQVMEKLITTVSRDAIDGTEVWKTVAFTLLDGLVQLSRHESQHSLLSAMTRHGILSNFVRGVKEADVILQSVLKPDPDDLNPLYVYESKLSLFIRMAQTRSGAERLLDANLVQTLSQCDFLDARPEADQSFMDLDSFLPSAIQRYHQLLMPTLQLVNAMLATLGPKHHTLKSQCLEFLSSHSPTLAILLKTETDYLALALVEEIHLIISICSNVLPTIPKTELVSATSNHGALHGAILIISARCLGSGPSFSGVRPQTDAEVQESKMATFGYDSGSVFDVKVRNRERLLRRSIVAYLGTVSEFTEPEITPSLSAITASPRNEDGHFFATVPSMGDALEALNVVPADLAQTLRRISELSAELGSPENIAVNNIKDIIRDVDENYLEDLDMNQKRALIRRELERIREDAKNDAKLITTTLEMLLLLIWRHVDYYADAERGGKTALRASTMMRAIPAPDSEVFKNEVAKKLGPSLQVVGSLNFNADSLGADWQANQAYVEIMCRRLRDSTGLLDGGVGSQDGGEQRMVG